jgi:hypothetical protein
MIDYFYNGDNYKMVVNKKLFACINVLFMGVVFIEGRRFKKYVSASNTLYLVEY